MKNFLKSKRGITLIALVITIVVLIILAAVIINLSLGNNGIFNRAKRAAQEYSNTQDYEETAIAKYSNQIDSYVSGERGTVTIDEETYSQLLENNEKINLKNNYIYLYLKMIIREV